MSITLHIERLVLEGLQGYDPAQLQAAIEAELTRLLAADEPAALLDGRQAVPTLAAPSIGAPAAGPQRLGTQIAAAIHAGLGSIGQVPARPGQGAR
jgi:hypothetical protein